MTVVEACAGKMKIDPPEDGSQLHEVLSSLIDEGISQNTSGSVFLSKVISLTRMQLRSHTCQKKGPVYLHERVCRGNPMFL